MTIFQELESAIEEFHQGKITPKEAEKHWKAFAFQPLIEILK